MIILDIIFGLLIGFIFGLIPNLHLNIFAYFFLLLNIINSSISLYFFISFAISNSISNFVPTCLFGIPTSENLFVLFPSHKLFLKGKSKLAILISLIASHFAILFSFIFLPILYILFLFLNKYNVFVYLSLLAILILFIFKEETFKSRFVVFSIIVFSGTLGIFTLKYNYFIKFPLLVITFGLFALPQLILSVFSNRKYILQKKKIDFPKIKSKWSLSILGCFASLFILLIPSFSSSQASLIVTKIKRKLNSLQYLFLYSLINISSIIFCIFLAIFFRKSRIGYFSILLETDLLFTNINIIYIIFTIIISVFLCSFLIYISINSFLNIFNKIKIKYINIFLIVFSILLIFILTNTFWSLFFIFISCLIGFLPIIFEKNRIILISYIMIPTLLYYIL